MVENFSKQVDTFSIIINMMHRARKNFLPVKYLRQAQVRLFNQAMFDSQLLDYDLRLFISNEDISNVIKNSNDILQYNDEADVIILSDDQDCDKLAESHCLDDYIMGIIHPRKVVDTDTIEQSNEVVSEDSILAEKSSDDEVKSDMSESEGAGFEKIAEPVEPDNTDEIIDSVKSEDTECDKVFDETDSVEKSDNESVVNESEIGSETISENDGEVLEEELEEVTDDESEDSLDQTFAGESSHSNDNVLSTDDLAKDAQITESVDSSDDLSDTENTNDGFDAESVENVNESESNDDLNITADDSEQETKDNAVKSKTKVNATLSEWEENMLDELAAKYNIPDNVILEIGVTFVVNEMSAAMSHNPCIINSIMPCVDVNPTNQNENSD